MSQPPPPPPRHGDNPRTTAGGSGLPPGKYDVFIIPEHSAGSGFLYLPSLKPQWNSFIAGVVSTMAVVIMSNLASPMVATLFSSPDRMWSFLWVTLVGCVGLAAFLLGRHQNEPSGPQQNKEGKGSGDHQKPGGGYGGAGSSWYTPPPQNSPPPNQGPPPPPPPPPQQEPPRDGGGQYQSWQEPPRQQEQPRQQPQPEPQPQAQPPPPPPPPQPEPQPQAQPQPEPEPKPAPREPKREEPKEEPKPKSKPAPEPKQQPQPPPTRPTSARSEAPKGAWEKAREEMRRREEERKAKEADAKKKEDTARRLRELREREAKERERREREVRERDLKEKLRKEQEIRDRERLEREVREKVERELREKNEKEAKEREAREREAREREREREAKLKEEAQKREAERARVEKERLAARERERKEREERLAKLRKEQEEKEKEKEKNERKGTSYAYSSVGEKTNMWPNGKPPSVAPSHAASTPPPSRPTSTQTAPPPQPPSPTKPAPSPTKSTASATGTEDTYSYRPYDKPKKPTTARKKSVSDFSESSWAPSASTARTTPPPSTRGPYTTNDPQKIVIRAVYGYLNQFSKTPASQLISGVGAVTDGLILRITSAGLFVDDDVRGVAQREWDVKAWTLKLVEVWCPVHAVSGQQGNTPGSVPTSHPFFKTMPQAARRAAERGATKTMLGEEAVGYIDELGRVCDGTCRRGTTAGGSAASGGSGEEKWRGLHLVRATIRDQEGKRYLFVIGEEEGWKIAAGLAALRGSSQVRALGVAGFSGMESKTLLDTLGWGA